VQTPAPFAYERAGTVDDALALLEQHGPEARLVAGGHSLLPMMKLRLARPEVLIDINDLTDLSYIRLDGSEIAIGAMTRHAELLDSALLAEHYAIFADAERVIADPIVRNRGTIGGSFCQADPSEDLAAVGSALGATLVVRGTGGTRTVAAREFHSGPYETVVAPNEILTEIRVPLRPGSGSAYEKVERRAGDWAIAAAGAFVTLDGDTVSDVGIGLTAVGAAGPGRDRREPGGRRRGRGRRHQPVDRPARSSGLQASSGGRAGSACAGARRGPSTRGRGLTCR
jgi:aerobic carbon-monoxide dehydrogenase medium subunit